MTSTENVAVLIGVIALVMIALLCAAKMVDRSR
jgi:hypothetical protein